jgi:hypothetical protein
MSDLNRREEEMQSGVQLMLYEIVGDHDGWEEEVERTKTIMNTLASELMTSFITLRSLPSTRGGPVKVRFFTQSRRMKQEWALRKSAAATPPREA